MNVFLQDIRYAVRILAQSPGFTSIAILTLALGIGANTALFSVVNGVLLNPLPYPQPDRLVALYSRTSTFAQASISYLNFLDWQRNNRSLASIAAYRSDDFNLIGSGEPERVRTEMISADFFSILGVTPLMGRDFTAQDDHAGAAPVVILSEGFWKRKLGGSQQILGQPIILNGTPYTVVGISRASYFFMGNNFRLSDAYVPIGFSDFAPSIVSFVRSVHPCSVCVSCRMSWSVSISSSPEFQYRCTASSHAMATFGNLPSPPHGEVKELVAPLLRDELAVVRRTHLFPCPGMQFLGSPDDRFRKELRLVSWVD